MMTWFVQHPTAANLIMMLILILGLVQVPALTRETLPAVAHDEVEIRIPYPGATPNEVEDHVCQPLESALESVVDLAEMRCDAREGLAIATAILQEGADMMPFLDDISTQVQAIDQFPAAAEQPIITELGRTEPVISIAITGIDDPVMLKAYAEAFKDRLVATVAVGTVTIAGFSDHHLQVAIPAWRLQQYGLSAVDIAQAVTRHNTRIPVGQLDGSDETILLRFDDQHHDIIGLQNIIVISSQTGAVIRLGELATITDRFDGDEKHILFDGQRAAVVNITKTQHQDSIRVRNAIAEFVSAEQAQLPPGMTIQLTQDHAAAINDRLIMLLYNGLQGFVLVLLVLWLFFGYRYSLWVTIGLPISFLGALFVMPWLGITLNMISMVGLLIGIGLLMDDAIVIAEQIASRLAQGEKPQQAVINGLHTVLPGVLSSFATTVLVFGSLAFISGELGQILRVIPIVLIVVLTVSLFEAFFILPHHLYHTALNTHQQPRPQWRQRFEQGLLTLQNHQFGRVLDWAVDYRYFTLGLMIMLLLIAIALPLSGTLKFMAFPDLEGDVVEARILLPQGTPLARTEQVVQQLTAALTSVNEHFRARQPHHQDVVKHSMVLYGNNPQAFETGAHVARVVIDLLPAETRDAPLDELFTVWRHAVGDLTDVIAIEYSQPAIGPAGRALAIRLIGDDLEQLKAASQALQTWFKQFAGVYNLNDDLRPGKREYRFHLKPDAAALGVDAQMVSEQLRAAFQGVTIDEFSRRSEWYTVQLRVADLDRTDAQDLDNFIIIGPTGALIPLAVIATIEEGRGWSRIHRINGQRTVTIEGDVHRDIINAQALLQAFVADFVPELHHKYPSIAIDHQGEQKEAAHTSQSVMRNVILGLMGVYLLLAIQFRDYITPIPIMLVLPTAVIGVIFGHSVLGLAFSMPSMVGTASLFGVLVNDAILLVVFIRSAQERGLAVHVAVKQAARARLRPILLTSLTTIAGLVPLLLEKSVQAQMLIPLAVSLAWGLAVATMMVLFLIPVIYAILDDFGWQA
jgi:multidrug efflux pump subunit AcrB